MIAFIVLRMGEAAHVRSRGESPKMSAVRLLPRLTLAAHLRFRASLVGLRVALLRRRSISRGTAGGGLRVSALQWLSPGGFSLRSTGNPPQEMDDKSNLTMIHDAMLLLPVDMKYSSSNDG